MEEIIFGFSTAKGFSPISWAIQKVEGTEYSHVYIRVFSKSINRWLLYHASRDNLHFTNWDAFQDENKVIEEYAIPVTEDEKSDILGFCVDRMGYKYGKIQLIGMGIVRIAKLWFNKEIDNPFSDDEKTQVCSELAGRVLQRLGESIPDKALEVEGPKWIRERVIECYTRRQNMSRV